MNARVAVAKELGITTHQLARRFHERDAFIAEQAKKAARKKRAVKKPAGKRRPNRK